MRRHTRNQSGFTIIEVLIVLAIGGMIMLIVFQAIPALKRNSRNAQRKDSVASILRAVSSYRLRNGGGIPPPCNGATCLGIGSFTEYEKLGYYDGANGTTIRLCNGKYAIDPAPPLPGKTANIILSFSGGCPVPSRATSTEKVMIYNYQTCSNEVIGDPSYDPVIGTTNAAGYSDVIALFGVEIGNGGVQPECQEL